MSFFLELIRNFKFVRLNVVDNVELNEEHIAILEERLASYEADPDNVIEWKTINDKYEK